MVLDGINPPGSLSSCVRTRLASCPVPHQERIACNDHEKPAQGLRTLCYIHMGAQELDGRGESPTEVHYTTLADSSRRFLRFSETRWPEEFILRIEIVRSGIAVSVRLFLLAFSSLYRGTSKTPTRLSEDTYGLQVRL